MNQPAAHTPLESLFLLQLLLTHGFAFPRISETLRANGLIKSDPSYDPARLSPDVLQCLFLVHLREEVGAAAPGVAGADGDGSPAKKRKLELPTLRDALEHVDKIPALVDRLYARYRDGMVRAIRDDEKRLQTTQKEIALVEKNLREQTARLAAKSSTPPALARDQKHHVDTKGPSPAPVPVARKPSTPMVQPKPPTPIASTATPKGTPSRPTPSPVPASVLQPPPGAGQPPQFQVPPDPTRKSTPGFPTGGLQWEKPYKPPQPQNTPSPAPGHALPGAVPRPAQPPIQPPQAIAASPVPVAQAQARPPPARPVLAPPQIPPQHAGQITSPALQAPQAGGTPAATPARPPSTTPIPRGALSQPQSAQPGMRPIAAAAPSPVQAGPTPQSAPQQVRPPQAGAQVSPAVSPAPGATFAPPRPQVPPIPDHVLGQGITTPVPGKKWNGKIAMPRTPALSTGSSSLTRGLGTKWATHSTPSTPRPLTMEREPDSPAFEPVSPPLRPKGRPSSVKKSALEQVVPKSASSTETPPSRLSRIQPSRVGPKARGPSATPSARSTRRSQSVMSQAEEPKIKTEDATPKPQEETGDTTADESANGRSHATATPGSVPRHLKRKRQETPVDPAAPPTHVLWTRGFTKVSSSALDHISGHRDANMFATAVRERDAPGYKSIVLQPQDITSIRSAIKHGNKAAVAAAGSLPKGDPGSTSVWLPISNDLFPPHSIINSAQLDRELAHMFCNAIMYNPDPNRGPGPGFLKRTREEEEEILGYRLDEDGVVKNTRGMFVEVEKLLGELRSAEKERSAPPPTPATTRPASQAVTPVHTRAADDTADEEDELAGEGEPTPSMSKRRRLAARS